MATDKRGRKLPKGIRQRSNRFEGRFTYKYQEYVVHGDTVTETQKAMNDLKYKLEHGIIVARKNITLDEWFNTWIENYKINQVKRGTCYNYQKQYAYYVQKKLGNKPLAEIRGEHIQKLFNDMAMEGYSKATIDLLKAVLSGMFKQAFKNGLIERDPVKLTDLPRKTKKKRVRHALTREQQALFMEYSHGSYLHIFFSVMLRTGMRCGEMQGLKYSDIDKKAGVIHVRRTLKQENKDFYEDTPKTQTSARDIPLTDDLRILLEAQRNFWGFKVEKMDRYLFCNANGGPLSQPVITNEIKRILKRIRDAGYDFPDITSHVFRHTFATRAIEAGMPPQVLKTILGHASLSMTMDLYSHVLPDTKAEEMEKIANVF